MKEDLVNGIARAMKIVSYTFIVILLLGNLKNSRVGELCSQCNYSYHYINAGYRFCTLLVC